MKKFLILGLVIVGCNTPQPPTNRAPVAAFTVSSSTANTGVAVNFDASSSSDPDGDALTYAWNFGDSTTGSGVTTSRAYATAGSKTITLTVSDGKLSNSTTRNVNISTTPPVAGAWRTIDTGAGGINANLFVRVRVSSNARGDAVAVWEDFPNKLRASLYNFATDTWSAIATFEQSGSFLKGAKVRVLPDGTAAMVYLEEPVSGAALRWRFVQSSGAAWGTPTDIITLDADAQGVAYSDLQVNTNGQIALAWQAVKSTSPKFSKSYVSTLSGATWTTEKLGDDSAGPAKIALDNNGQLMALYGSRTSTASSTNSVFSRQFSFTSGWSVAQIVLTTNPLYDCSINSSPCYAISTGQNGKILALLWDAVGTFSGEGATTSKIYDTSTNSWTMISGTVSTNTALPFLYSDATGNAIAVYNTRNASNATQLASRRFDASTDTWTAVRALDGYFAAITTANANGEVLAHSDTASIGAKTTANTGTDWSAVTDHNDPANCILRFSDIALDNNGMGLMVQICATPNVNLPALFVRAKRFSIR